MIDVQRAARRGDEESHEPLIPGQILSDLDGHSANRGMGLQDRFNLFKLDPVPPDFDLSIGAPQILKLTVRQPLGQITSPVEACTWLQAEWVTNEPLSSQISTLHVTTRKTNATDIELSRSFNRHGLQVPIEHVHLDVLNRATDRHLSERSATQFGGRQVADGRRDRHFGRAVGIQQPHARTDIPLPGHQWLPLRTFPSNHHREDFRGKFQGFTPKPRNELMPVGGWKVQQGYVPLPALLQKPRN